MNLSGLNLYHLKYFHDVARFRSFSQAATTNFVSRPAISKAVLRLEEIIGYRLFEHEKKVVQLTKEGRRFALSLEPILKQLEKAVKGQGTSNNHFQIGVSYSIFKALLQHPLATFFSEDPHNRFDIQFGTSRQLIGLLSSEEIDFAILLEPQESRIFHNRELHSGRFVLASSKDNRNLNTLITTEERPETLLVKHLHGHQFTRHLKIASWSACSDLIINRMGVGLIPDFLFDKKTMKQLLLKEKIPYTIWAVWRPETNPSIFLKALNKK